MQGASVSGALKVQGASVSGLALCPLAWRVESAWRRSHSGQSELSRLPRAQVEPETTLPAVAGVMESE